MYLSIYICVCACVCVCIDRSRNNLHCVFIINGSCLLWLDSDSVQQRSLQMLSIQNSSYNLKFRKISVAHHTKFIRQIVLKFCTDYGIDTQASVQNFETISQQRNKWRTSKLSGDLSRRWVWGVFVLRNHHVSFVAHMRTIMRRFVCSLCCVLGRTMRLSMDFNELSLRRR